MAATTPLHKQVLSRYPSVHAWLELLANLGRATATLDAYSCDIRAIHAIHP